MATHFWNYLLEPRVACEQLVKPVRCSGLFILLAVVNDHVFSTATVKPLIAAFRGGFSSLYLEHESQPREHF